jgi:L-rhamnose mutarotase
MKPTPRKLAFVSLAVVGLLLAGSDTVRPVRQRHAWITGLRPEMASRYRDLHAHPWPSVNRTLKECHIENFSIWQREIEGKLYLFAYLEYTGSDFDADMKKMAADPETKRWWHQTDPCQLPLPDAAAKGKMWTDMTEVYYLQ